MVLHLSAAPHDIAPGGVIDAVAGAAGHVHGLQDVDMGTVHLAVPHQEAGRRQSGQEQDAHHLPDGEVCREQMVNRAGTFAPSSP